MKYRLLAIGFALIAVNAFCGTWVVWWMHHGKALTNTANFHEICSTTNLAPAVLSIAGEEPCFEVKIGTNGEWEPNRAKMAEPGQPWSTHRLIWAATDDTNWVVHYEWKRSPESRGINYCILGVSLPDLNYAWKLGGRFKDYKEFITSGSSRPVGQGF